MNRTIAVLLIAPILLLAGCGATLKQTWGDGASRYAPSNEKRGGIVEYLADGAKSAIKSRREDSYKKMHNYCGGSYKIVNEGSRFDGSQTMMLNGTYPPSEVTLNSNMWFIQFECENL